MVKIVSDFAPFRLSLSRLNVPRPIEVMGRWAKGDEGYGLIIPLVLWNRTLCAEDDG